MSSSLEPQLIERAGIVGPALAHLHPEREVKSAAEQPVELQTGGASDSLQALAFCADDDRLVTRPVDPDRRVHDQLAAVLLHALDLHGDTVGQLLLQLQRQLLADELGDAK